MVPERLRRRFRSPPARSRALSISMGSAPGLHTPRRRDAAQCWGHNHASGSSGSATPIPSATTSWPPSGAVVLGTTVSSLVSGVGETCGLFVSDGGWRCWGINSSGELGHADLTIPRRDLDHHRPRSFRRCRSGPGAPPPPFSWAPATPAPPALTTTTRFAAGATTRTAMPSGWGWSRPRRPGRRRIVDHHAQQHFRYLSRSCHRDRLVRVRGPPEALGEARWLRRCWPPACGSPTGSTNDAGHDAGAGNGGVAGAQGGTGGTASALPLWWSGGRLQHCGGALEWRAPRAARPMRGPTPRHPRPSCWECPATPPERWPATATIRSRR